MKLITGLGNPGERYAKTRHNVGFCVLDRLYAAFGVTTEREKMRGLLAETTVKGEKILFLKPMTYMNDSGESLIEVIRFFKLDPRTELLVIHDDLDLPVGRIRVRIQGGSGGHNGLKSIIAHVGEDFARVKCGVGRPTIETIDYVLGRFPEEEQNAVSEMLTLAKEAAEDFIRDMDTERLMQKYNSR